MMRSLIFGNIARGSGPHGGAADATIDITIDNNEWQVLIPRSVDGF